MLLRLLLLVGCVVAAACASHPGSIAPSQEDLEKREREMTENFRAEYSDYEVCEHDLQQLGKTEIDHLSDKMRISEFGGLRLELCLGHRWRAKPNSVFRTGSRYRLIDSKGKLLASAESTLAREDLGAGLGHASIECLYDEQALVILIAEEQSWATQRYILISPHENADDGDKGFPAAWTVSYVRIPQRGSPYLPPVLPKLLGIRDDRLFLMQNDRLYAIPIRILEDAPNLEYTIG